MQRPEDERPFVFAVCRVLSVSALDGGRTIALRLLRADGGETAILVPAETAQELVDRIRKAVAGDAPDAMPRSEG